VKTQLEYIQGQPSQKYVKIFTEHFCLLKNCLSETEFYHLICSYLEKYPAENFNPFHIGKNLPQFLRRSRRWSEAPILSEVARLELLKLELQNSPHEYDRIRLFTSLYDVSLKSKKNVNKKLSSPIYLAINIDSHRKLKIHCLTDIEYRVLNWSLKDFSTSAMTAKALRLGFSEKSFYKTLYSLKKRQILNFSFDLM
jgi:hypothetical protein